MNCTNPIWIGKFREKGYDMLSVILEASLETCLFDEISVDTNYKQPQEIGDEILRYTAKSA